MTTKKGDFCPLIRKACIEDKCKWWTHIRGKHPQSAAELDMPDCSIKWLPVLMIEMSQMERQTGAAVESFRNESVDRQDKLLHLANGAQRRRLVDGA